jgi:parallel beta-helix repeat protein
MKKVVSGVMLMLIFLTNILTLAFNIKPTWASGTIYINESGAVVPPTAPIRRDGDVYTFTADINETIVVMRSNIIIDGNGYTVEGTGDGIGLSIEASNVTIKNTKIMKFQNGIYLLGSGGIIINNTITDNWEGGIYLDDSDGNSLVGNTFANNYIGIIFAFSFDNIIFHNNFINNPVFFAGRPSGASWDNGYPSGGNYWSGHVNYDFYSGPYQNETGSDGIIDIPYSGGDCWDPYPLSAPIALFDAGVWNETSYTVDIISNSAVSNFQLNISEKIMRFNVTGETGSGFCRVTIPNVIIQELWNGNFTVLIDGRRIETRNWTELEDTYLYFTYTHSEHEITILQTSITTLEITTTSGGTTDPEPGIYNYTIGSSAQVTAIPETNYRLAYWELDGMNVGSANPIEVLMDRNHTLNAVFSFLTYNLTISVTTGGTTDPAPGTYSYTLNSTVQVTAIPDAGYSFSYWLLDDNVRTENPITVIMDANHTLHAVFVPVYTLTITSTTGGTTNPASGTYTYPEGSLVNVTGIPNPNYRFERWLLDGSDVGSQNPISVLMDSNHTLHAVFTQITYQLSIISTAGGTTNPAPGIYTQVNGTQVVITAVPYNGYSFDYWLLDGVKTTQNPITIIMNANYTLEAYFVDNIPPEISEPWQDPLPDNVQPFQNVTVWINVTDYGTGIKNVTLWYSINNGTSWTIRNMTALPIPSDTWITYEATIDGYGNCTWVTYKIIAYDNAENNATKDNNGYGYQYHVIPEYPSTLIRVFIMATTLITTSILKIKKRRQLL